jgi:hypothetical protein
MKVENTPQSASHQPTKLAGTPPLKNSTNSAKRV